MVVGPLIAGALALGISGLYQGVKRMGSPVYNGTYNPIVIDGPKYAPFEGVDTGNVIDKTSDFFDFKKSTAIVRRPAVSDYGNQVSADSASHPLGPLHGLHYDLLDRFNIPREYHSISHKATHYGLATYSYSVLGDLGNKLLAANSFPALFYSLLKGHYASKIVAPSNPYVVRLTIKRVRCSISIGCCLGRSKRALQEEVSVPVSAKEVSAAPSVDEGTQSTEEDTDVVTDVDIKNEPV